MCFATSLLVCAFATIFAIAAATPTTEADVFTVAAQAAAAVTEKAEESSKITTFVPVLTATKIPNPNEKKSARYDGDQVLRVYTVNSKHRKKIKEIERDNSKYGKREVPLERDLEKSE